MSMIAALLLAVLQPNAAAGVEVDVGRFDPSEFPEAIRIERRMPEGEMVNRVEAMLSDGRCRIEGAHDRRFNIVVPFAMLMGADGTTETIVVHEAGCEALETLIGQIVRAQLQRGDFRPTHQQGERWYVSEIGFAMGVENQPVSVAANNPDQVICRQARPALGSRTRLVRTCLTGAQWVAYEADREQLRRDIRNAARCGVNNDHCESK